MSETEVEQSENSRDGSFWENGRDIGHLASSQQDMAQERKDIIRFAIGLNIRDIRTYAGFKGDLLVEITAAESDVINKIKDWAENLEMQTVVKENVMTGLHELFCITPDDVYELDIKKDDDPLY